MCSTLSPPSEVNVDVDVFDVDVDIDGDVVDVDVGVDVDIELTLTLTLRTVSRKKVAVLLDFVQIRGGGEEGGLKQCLWRNFLTDFEKYTEIHFDLLALFGSLIFRLTSSRGSF